MIPYLGVSIYMNGYLFPHMWHAFYMFAQICNVSYVSMDVTRYLRMSMGVTHMYGFVSMSHASYVFLF
jgi:hypothetical protein